MPAHAVWKGFLEFFRVSVPVKAYPAAVRSARRIRLNLLHADCLSPIRYVKQCPAHGEVPPGEIVRGFAVNAERYVVLDHSEMESLRPPRSRSVAILGVIDPSEVSPRHYSGTSYYLMPDGPVAQRPYALLRDVLARAGVAGYSVATLHRRERLVLIQPLGKLLTLSVLHYAEEVVDPQTFDQDVADVAASDDELRLGLALTEAARVPATHLAGYRDSYQEGLAEIVALKLGDAGGAAASPTSAGPSVALVEVLLQSIELAKAAEAAKPPKLTAPGSADSAEAEQRQQGAS